MAVTVGIDELSGDKNADKITVVVNYADRVARIEIPGQQPPSGQLPLEDFCRLELHELLKALEEWVRSSSKIQWHGQDRGK
jgi:hypothetical protein